MKITFIHHCIGFAGGVRVMAIYAEKLKQRGHEVFSVSLPLPTPSLRQQLTSVLRGKGIIKNPGHLSSFFDNLDVEHKILETYRPITDKDIPDADVVIATWWETAEWVANLSKSKGAKAYFMQDYGAKGQELEKITPTWGYPLHIITISQSLVKLISEYYPKIPISLVSNAVDFETFNAPSRTKQRRPTVGLVYKPLSDKGIDIALKAVQKASQTVPYLQLFMFGPVQLTPSVILPAASHYYYQPPDEQLKIIYASCDAWLFPSIKEGFGLPILEAMACRTPVIGTPAGAAPELISQGGGILVKPEDPEDMARAILDIHNLSNEQWQVMSDAAYHTATKYSWDDATDLFEAALYKAIERTKNGDLKA